MLESILAHDLWVVCLACCALPALLAISLVTLVFNFPSGPKLQQPEWPSLPWLYAQVIYSACTKKGTNLPQQLPCAIEAALTQPKGFNLGKLARFRALVGHKHLPEQEVPVMYPIALSFRLYIQAMALPQFPLNVLGSVLARNRTEVYKALRPEDKLVYSCRVGASLHTTPKGDTEAELIGTATMQDGELVWKSTVTVIVLGKNRKKGAATDAAALGSAASTVQADVQEIDVWRLDGGVGRKYGLINGDLNPIHISALTSSVFGFKRPIAHALFLVARAEASLRNSGVACSYPCVMETEFKRPTLLPGKAGNAVAGA